MNKIIKLILVPFVLIGAVYLIDLILTLLSSASDFNVSLAIVIIWTTIVAVYFLLNKKKEKTNEQT